MLHSLVYIDILEVYRFLLKGKIPKRWKNEATLVPFEDYMA
jgi:hypothetical protein